MLDFVQEVQHVCLYDVLFGHEPDVIPHDRTFSCPSNAIGSNTDYNIRFKTLIKFPNNLVCFKCAVPRQEAFKPEMCQFGKCLYPDILKPLAFLIFESPQLRQAIFSFLVVDVNDFPTLALYAVWLGTRPRGAQSLLNILDIAFAYAYLRSHGFLPTATIEL